MVPRISKKNHQNHKHSGSRESLKRIPEQMKRKHEEMESCNDGVSPETNKMDDDADISSNTEHSESLVEASYDDCEDAGEGPSSQEDTSQSSIDQKAEQKRIVGERQAHEIIAKVYHYLKEEYKFIVAENDPKCDLSPLSNISQRTSEATGVSIAAVNRILKENKNVRTTSTKFFEKYKNRPKKEKKIHPTVDKRTEIKFERVDVKTDNVQIEIECMNVVKTEPVDTENDTVVKTEPQDAGNNSLSISKTFRPVQIKSEPIFIKTEVEDVKSETIDENS